MFAAVFPAIAPRQGLDPSGALVTVAGVFTGSLSWWCAMVSLACAIRRAIGPVARRWIDRLSGAILALFGVAELRRAI